MKRSEQLKLLPKTLSGKVAVITGFTTGIGLQTAVELAARGATCVLLARNPMRGENVKNHIKDLSGNDQLFVLKCDLSAQADIHTAVGEFRRRFDRLDILVNNAGMITRERKTSPDGYEMTFAVNHLAYFLLTGLLLDLLKQSADGRVINVASAAHKRAQIDFNDLQHQRGEFKSFAVYGFTKLCNILFTKELARRLDEEGCSNVTVNCLHPGVIASDITRDYPTIVQLLWKLFTISPVKGARTSVYLAADPAGARTSGKYFINKKEVLPSEAAQNAHAAQRLWEESARMCGLEPADLGSGDFSEVAGSTASSVKKKNRAKKTAGKNSKKATQKKPRQKSSTTASPKKGPKASGTKAGATKQGAKKKGAIKKGSPGRNGAVGKKKPAAKKSKAIRKKK